MDLELDKINELNKAMAKFESEWISQIIKIYDLLKNNRQSKKTTELSPKINTTASSTKLIVPKFQMQRVRKHRKEEAIKLKVILA